MSKHTILLMDDEPMFLSVVSSLLQATGYDTREAATVEAGLEIARSAEIDLVLLDINIPAVGGEAALNQLRDLKPDLPVVILTGENDASLAVRCMKAGAVDFLNKPCDGARLKLTIRNALQLFSLEYRLREVTAASELEHNFDSLFGRSPCMHRIFDQLRVLSQSDIGVLIEGASGTGKELVARGLHRKGPRSDGPFMAVNCGAIPETLLESELFGHERGAFTGAVNSRAGCFEQADRGTLFLDEIGEMRPDMQVRLLRVLETREVHRLGGAKPIRVDVRVVTATNRDLRERVASGAFREDLYYRLAVYRLHLPPLKERDNDVVELADRFLLEFGVKLHKRGLRLTQRACAMLRSYPWPGNVRQLRNAIERAALMASDTQVDICDFPEEIAATPIDPGALRATTDVVDTKLTEPTKSAVLNAQHVHSASPAAAWYSSETEILTMDSEERRILERALRITKGDVTEAAQRLAISRATLYRRVKELNLAHGKSEATA